MLTGRGARDLDSPPQQFGTISLIGNVQLSAAIGKKKREVEGNDLWSYHILSQLPLSRILCVYFFERAPLGRLIDVFLRSTLPKYSNTSPHGSTRLR
jgi:hypothetical protein